MTSTRWCFTLNNPSDDDEQKCSDFLSSGVVTYGVLGRETGESGTPHLQGFVILGSSQRLSYLRRRLSDRAHYERANGTSEQARDYCKKDGDFEEFGTFPARQGHRTDLDELLEWAKQFESDNGRPAASPDIAKHQPRAYLKYPRFRALCAHRAARRQLEFGDPLPWQLDLAEYVADEPEGVVNDRKVRFIVDPEGGKGKTWFCRWMLTNHYACQVLGVGRASDIAHMIDETKHIFLFNVARGQMEFLSYSILEQLKDRILISGKYHGATKLWTRKTIVVVLCNEFPDYTKMTNDRYDVIEL